MRYEYKHFTIFYEKKNDKIVVTSILAHYNYPCNYGDLVYASLKDVLRDIDDGKFGK